MEWRWGVKRDIAEDRGRGSREQGKSPREDRTRAGKGKGR